ncbi:hypothetical protein PQQ63_26150 [Paraburkholderia metrosideri]|uniref:Uncharacterized protein n=1 Tax=Paraburkholderia metrosideri TaxID=580937 RepID=A0ABW9DYV5_9BURK
MELVMITLSVNVGCRRGRYRVGRFNVWLAIKRAGGQATDLKRGEGYHRPGSNVCSILPADPGADMVRR